MSTPAPEAPAADDSSTLDTRLDAAPETAPAVPLELEIYNIPLRLRAPEPEHDRLRRAARHVDSVMRDQLAVLPLADPARLAVQAAFIVATEYFRSLDQHLEAEAARGPATDPTRSATAAVTRRLDTLVEGLDQSLAELETAARPARMLTADEIASAAATDAAEQVDYRAG